MARNSRTAAAGKKTPATGKRKAPAKAAKPAITAPPARTSAVGSLRPLRNEIDRLFEEFDKGLGRWPSPRRLFDLGAFFEPFRPLEPIWAGKQPTADVVESDQEFRVTAEMPGVAENDIDVTVSDGMLTINGEKTEEKEEKKKDFHVSERRFGSFRRSFALPKSADVANVRATVKDGVLTVVLPKAAAAKETAKKVAIGKG